MIKVLHLTTSMGGSGVSNLLYSYYINIPATEELHFDFCAIETPVPQPFEDKFKGLGCQVDYMPKSYFKRIPFLYKKMKSGGYDVIHSHIELASAIYLLIAFFAGVRTRIAHAHMAFCKYPGIKNKFLKCLLNRISTHKMGCSQDAVEWLFGKKQIHTAVVLRNAINVGKFAFAKNVREDYRKQFGLEGKTVVGFVGRFTYQKNIFFLLDIFEEYHKRNPESILLMVGNGELESVFFEEVQSREIGASVLHVGNRFDVNCFMQAMDCMLLPSRWEGLGIVLIEAQAASLPTIAPRDTVPYKDTNVSSYIDYCSIHDSKDCWCDKLEEMLNIERVENTDAIIGNGYDIRVEAPKLLQYYKKIVEKSMF